MATVLVNGTARPLGQRVVELVRSDPTVVEVLAVERDPHGAGPAGIEVLSVEDLRARRAGGSLAGPIDVVVLAAGQGPDRDGSTMGGVDLVTARGLLAALGDAEVRRVVVLSSAMVYGAWPDNPVPLTEEALLRPNPGCRYAADKAELERCVAEWNETRDAPGRAGVTLLRPAVTVHSDPDAVDWMERSLWHTPTARAGDADPLAQFLHLDDLARAVEHVRRFGPDGPLNVAPDGWITTERQVELAGRATQLRVPAAVAAVVARARWSSGATSTPPDIVAYTVHPWVIANDRLRASGWAPTYSNDEAFIVANREGWWSSLNARRRQDVALGVLVAGAVALGGAAAGVARLVRQR